MFEVSKFTVSGTPIAYESSWLLFLKILSLNLISQLSLFENLKLRLTSNKASRFEIWSSAWIDNGRFLESTGFSGEVLDQAFLDRLFILKSGMFSSAVKHCPLCISKGYHCSLFQLHLIKRCPWHNLPLIACEACTNLVRRGRFVDPENINIETDCGHVNYRVSDSVVFTRFTHSEAEDVRSSCNKIVLWLESCSKYGEIFYSVMREREGGIFNEVRHQLAFNHINGQDAPDPIRGIYSSSQVTWISWSTDPSENNYLESDLLAVYKSVKRMLKKRFLFGHYLCVNFLSCCSDGQRLSVSLPRMCALSVAFIAWQVSVSGMYDSFIEKQEKSNSLSDFDLGGELNLRGIAYYWISRFLDIWSSLEIYEERKTEFWPKISLTKAYARCTLKQRNASAYFNSHGVHYVLLPSICYLLGASRARCKARSSVGAMISGSAEGGRGGLYPQYRVENTCFMLWPEKRCASAMQYINI